MIYWLFGYGFNVAASAIAHSIEYFCVAYAVRKAWDLAGK